MNKAKAMAIVIVLMAVVGLMSGCTPDELKGTLIENVPPIIYFTNLPLGDSVYTSNARIYWYGEDEDGRVVAFYYFVAEETAVGGDPDAYIENVLDTTGIDRWTMTGDTYVEVRLIASFNETDTIPQFLFVKCQDDAGAFSSSTIYLYLSRVNRLPETYLTILPGMDTLGNVTPVWCLPDTNALWNGLDFAWEGKDTLDFPEGAPDFEYEWKIFGPYDSSLYDASLDTIYLGIADTTTDMLLIASCDASDSGYLRRGLDGVMEACEDPWVLDKDVTITNFPTGCYIFTARVRDDALVPDSTAAWGAFMTVMPLWMTEPGSVRDVMLIRATQFRNAPTLGGYPQRTDTAGTANYPDSVLKFYNEMLAGAGYDTLLNMDVFGSTDQVALGEEDYPGITDLAKHRLIIFDNMDYNTQELKLTQYFTYPLADYLNVGGKIWVIGRQSYISSPPNYAGYSDFESESIAFLFFDLSAARYTQASILIGDTVEFVGARSVDSDFGDLVIDPVRTAEMLQHGINKVEVLIRNSNLSSTIFTYEAANPDTMVQFQFSPCAVRYNPIHHIFKTSYFSFPLYMMDNSAGAVQATFTNMLAWFLEE